MHKRQWYCRCAYNVYGVVVDYGVYGVDGHVNSIMKLREELANAKLRIAELEGLVRGNSAGRCFGTLRSSLT